MLLILKASILHVAIATTCHGIKRYIGLENWHGSSAHSATKIVLLRLLTEAATTSKGPNRCKWIIIIRLHHTDILLRLSHSDSHTARATCCPHRTIHEAAPAAHGAVAATHLVLRATTSHQARKWIARRRLRAHAH